MEATSKVVRLPEDDTDAFALFIRWLYVGEINGKLFNSKDQIPGSEILGTWSGTEDGSASEASAQIYLQACILGDRLGCPVFQDLAMIELIRCHQSETIKPMTMCVIFEHSSPGSRLRQFSIDEFRRDVSLALCGNAASYVSAAKSVEDFGLDFLKACVETGAREPSTPERKGDDTWKS